MSMQHAQVCVTIFSTGSKFQFTELHTLPLATVSTYVAMVFCPI